VLSVCASRAPQERLDLLDKYVKDWTSPGEETDFYWWLDLVADEDAEATNGVSSDA
jgi:hypothetical protein